jgi:hypothetical protein
MITNDFIIPKDFRTYSINFLRQEETIRDHAAGRRSACDVGGWSG